MADPEAPRGPDEMPPQSEFAKRARIRLVEATRDRVVCEMDVTEQHTNRNGVLHGSAMMTQTHLVLEWNGEG